jgi:hypothetical protein
MAFSHDGVFDIVLGVMLIAAGAYIYTDLVALGGIIVVLIIPLVQGLKRAITVPRLPASEGPDDSGLRQFRGIMIGSVIFGVLMLAGVAIYLYTRSGNLPDWLSWLDEGMPYAILTIVAIFLLIGTYVTRDWRFVAYAVLAAVAYGLISWLEIHLGAGLMVLGGVVLLLGLALVARFVRTHPVLPPEDRLQFF